MPFPKISGSIDLWKLAEKHPPGVFSVHTDGFHHENYIYVTACSCFTDIYCSTIRFETANRPALKKNKKTHYTACVPTTKLRRSAQLKTKGSETVSVQKHCITKKEYEMIFDSHNTIYVCVCIAKKIQW